MTLTSKLYHLQHTHKKKTTGSKINNQKPMMILPYAGEKGCILIKSLKRDFKENFQLTSKHA